MKRFVQIIGLASLGSALLASPSLAQVTVQTVIGNTVGSRGSSTREIMVHEVENSEDFSFSSSTNSRRIRNEEVQIDGDRQINRVEDFGVNSGSFVLIQQEQTRVTNVRVQDSFEFADFSSNSSVSTSF